MAGLGSSRPTADNSTRRGTRAQSPRRNRRVGRPARTGAPRSRRAIAFAESPRQPAVANDHGRLGPELSEHRFDVKATAGTTLLGSGPGLTLERTMMSWVHTAITLIGFGFTIVLFFERLPALTGSEPPRRPAAPFYFGLLLIGAGVVALVVSGWQYRTVIAYLRHGEFAAIAGTSQRPDAYADLRDHDHHDLHRRIRISRRRNAGSVKTIRLRSAAMPPPTRRSIASTTSSRCSPSTGGFCSCEARSRSRSGLRRSFGPSCRSRCSSCSSARGSCSTARSRCSRLSRPRSAGRTFSTAR